MSWRALSTCNCVANPLIFKNLTATQLQRFCMSAAVNASDHQGQTRLNQIGIQMLSKSLHGQLFGGREDLVPPEILSDINDHLSQHGLQGREGSLVSDTNFKLPTLLGKNPDEHFKQIAIEQSEPYLNLAKHLSRRPLPSMPNEWLLHPGWTKYDAQTGERILVDIPDDDALVFDVEVCVRESPLPVLAVAASRRAWYSWVSDSLVDRKQYGWLSQCVADNLIPLERVGDGERQERGERMKRLVVGHMVGYDRARIREQYDFNVSGLNAVASLDVCCIVY